ncbi:MAG: AMIN domain-containing protein [Gemmatimonadaceae bacterium]
MMFPLITLVALAVAHGPTTIPSSPHAPVACAGGVGSGGCARKSGSSTVTGVSVVPGSGHADVVVGVESPVEVQDFTLDAPFRVVLDLKGATLSGSPSAYDHVARGGITDVRVSQFRPNIVRLVLQLDGTHAYEVKRSGSEVRIAVSGGASEFAAWHGDRWSRDSDNGARDEASVAPQHQQRNYTTAVAQPSSIQGQPQSTQPRITVTYQDADIKDVIAAFATFAGRTIVIGKDVGGTVTAEIRNQPWDVALRAILQGQGLAAAEDPASGIITVDSYANVQSRQALEPLVTQLIPINYANADALVAVVTKLLARDCTSSSGAAAAAGTSSGQGGGTGGAANTTCITRGAVASNPGTNTLIVTETPSRIGGIINYVQHLDVRTPQVAIKAKIIFVNRTDIENLGLSYDIGSRNQFFSQLVKRTDPSTLKPIDTNGDGVPDAVGGGTPITGDQISLGGNTLSAIANASSRIASPALSLVYSAAIGKFSLTSFLDALKEVRLADLQAEPSIVTVDNREARIQVGQQVPLRTLDASSGGGISGAIPRATVTTKDVGIILTVTPHITNNRQILMDVHAENSDAQLASSDIGYVFNTQSADNRLLVADGETAVIGGLTVTSVTQTKTGIPVLVDLPLVGRLFGVTGKSEEKRDLLILITPHVIDAGERVGAGNQ